MRNKIYFWAKEITIAVLAVVFMFAIFPFLVAILLGLFFNI